MTCSGDGGRGEAADTSQLLISFLPDCSLRFPERGLDSSKSLANQGPPAFSITFGFQPQIPIPLTQPPSPPLPTAS